MIHRSYLIEQNINILKEKLVLFYGENTGLKDDFKNQIKKKILNIEIVHLLQDEIIKNEDLLFNEVLNLSLFEKEKYLIIDNVNDKILPIIEKIITRLGEQRLFLFADILDKKSKLRSYFEKNKICGIIPCYADNEIAFKKIILEKLKGFKNITTQNINLIIEKTGLDRVKLNNEINKIVTFFYDKNLETKKLEELLNIRENENFNDLRDEALSGNKINTNNLISNTFLEKEKNIMYINYINQRLTKITEIIELARGKSLESSIESIRPPIFWKDKPKIKVQASKWSLEKIKIALSLTHFLELKIKSNSVINHDILLKKLLVDVCILANS
tara:strand:- start:1662 stop:2651 length:990 start_codon:yes stop_codon:yes gene_type:complete